jgi:hypothetical protein
MNLAASEDCRFAATAFRHLACCQAAILPEACPQDQTQDPFQSRQ